jgi:hypothetical protein
MALSLRIESAREQAFLELKPLDKDYFVAQIHDNGLEAIARVSSYMSFGLGEFFAGLASDWKGWEGERKWSSMEGELTLSARTDGLGHVYLLVYLCNGTPPTWDVRAELCLEAGALDRYAARARLFGQENACDA